uniref:Secreted protein n=1 Tax=Heterorhabditis bacteriophora TaxID=37862 RepID=A0A1I7WHH9_HETBA
MIHLLNFALFLFILYSGKCNPFYRTLLYGEKFKGFLLTLACATVILPGQPLMRASFHASPIEGHIHVIPLKDKVNFILCNS